MYHPRDVFNVMSHILHWSHIACGVRSMATSTYPPALSPAQIRASEGPFGPVPRVCVVTGGTGFVGQRLVEMLAQVGWLLRKCVCVGEREEVAGVILLAVDGNGKLQLFVRLQLMRLGGNLAPGGQAADAKACVDLGCLKLPSPPPPLACEASPLFFSAL